MDGPCVLPTKSINDVVFHRRAYATLPEDLVFSHADENQSNSILRIVSLFLLKLIPVRVVLVAERRLLSNVDILEPTVFDRSLDRNTSQVQRMSYAV